MVTAWLAGDDAIPALFDQQSTSPRFRRSCASCSNHNGTMADKIADI
jgi:hypothetical protein